MAYLLVFRIFPAVKVRGFSSFRVKAWDRRWADAIVNKAGYRVAVE